MKHATGKTLKTLESLLREIRKSQHLKEKNHGIFYLKSKAYLHFHEDEEGTFADVKKGNKWVRLKVPDNKKEWKKFARKLLIYSGRH